MHEQVGPLLIGNVRDVSSARAAEKAGFAALGTSSAAMAASLGYPDGEQMSFSELSHLVKRIRDSVSLPLSVDMEAGYGSESEEIAGNIRELTTSGVVGINLEDSLSNGNRELRPVHQFAKLLRSVREVLRAMKIEVFVNVRSDAFLLGHSTPLAESLLRIKEYEKAGADGIFLPGLVDPSGIKNAVSSTALPLNLMCMPNLPDFSQLQELGVKRISMGNFLFEKSAKALEVSLAEIHRSNSFHSIFNP